MKLWIKLAPTKSYTETQMEDRMNIGTEIKKTMKVKL